VVNITRRSRNPFDLDPPCAEFVPGYGDPNADFHVIGDHPGRHGGKETGIPFTRSKSGRALQQVLEAVGLLAHPGDEPTVANLYFSYIYLCVDDDEPEPRDYAEMERFFDAELRAITAHVLLPVGERAIRQVLEQYTTDSPDDVDVEAIHATEISTGAWLVIPIAEPATWTADQRDALIDALETLRRRDYRRESDLGRFNSGSDPYYVR